MVKRVKYTLVTDGSSDRSLLSVLDWLWGDVGSPAQGEWFDPRPFAPPSFSDRIRKALDLFPCDILFVHRDAEGKSPAERRQQIRDAVEHALPVDGYLPYVCVIPVRMTEAWFLFNEAAIRRASGNPNGSMALELPSLNRCEHLPDPKSILFDTFKKASGKSGRRLKKLNVVSCRMRLADIIRDFSPLRKLEAFTQLEKDFRSALKQLHFVH